MGEARVPYLTVNLLEFPEQSCSINDKWKLPVTTTKRGIDTSSETYLYIKGIHAGGIEEIHGGYTNLWKQDPDKEKKYQKLRDPFRWKIYFQWLPISYGRKLETKAMSLS